MPKRALISLILKVSGNVNADMGVGTRVPLKKIITWNHEVKPFVSARCIRRCIRERLYEKGFSIDPLQLVGKQPREQLGDIGNPLEYVDDDLFGFLKPQEPPLKRSSPIKISHLISLRHAEIKVEFAARFPRDFLTKYTHGYPVPFEIEVAEWIGKLNVIVTDRVGVFSEDELSEDLRRQLGSEMRLGEEERKKRLRGFLEIILWEGWVLPRGAQSPSVPEYYYAVIGLTEHFIPIFGYIDITEEGKLDNVLIDNMREMYSRLLDKLYILDYKNGHYIEYTHKSSSNNEGVDKQVKKLNSENIRAIIDNMCEYIVR